MDRRSFCAAGASLAASVIAAGAIPTEIFPETADAPLP